MADVYLIQNQTLQDIANAIRTKGGPPGTIIVADYAAEILALPTGEGGDSACCDGCYCHIEDADYNENGELVLSVWTHGRDPHEGIEILEAYFTDTGEMICVCGVYGALWPDKAEAELVSIEVYHVGQYDMGTYAMAITDAGGDVAAAVFDGSVWYGVYSLGSYSTTRTEALTDTVALADMTFEKEES